jgi:hypothetical protein
MLKLSHIFSLFAVMAMLLLAVGCQKMEDLEPVSNELPGLRHGHAWIQAPSATMMVGQTMTVETL